MTVHDTIKVYYYLWHCDASGAVAKLFQILFLSNSSNNKKLLSKKCLMLVITPAESYYGTTKFFEFAPPGPTDMDYNRYAIPFASL